MKHTLFACLILALALAGPARAEQVVSSEITGVTLFTNKAQVTRTAAAEVDSGVTRLVVVSDAFSVESNSVTAAIRGEGRILGVQVLRMPLPEAPQEKIRDIKTRLDDLLQQQQALTDKKTALAKQEAFLNAVVDFSGTQIPTEIQTRMPSIDSLDTTLSFLGQRFNAIFDQQRAIEKKREHLGNEIDALKRELEMVRGNAGKTRTGIEILFDSDKKQSITLETKYMTPQARWTPVYRASVDDAMTGVALSMMAEVFQKTGEDWTDVTLSVSNVMPSHGGRLPDLHPWWLDYHQTWAQKSRAPQMAMAERGMEAESDALGAPKAKMAQAERRQTALAFEYELPMPVTVASRDKETLLPIFTKTIDGEFYHFAVPKQIPRTYLVCEAEADSELLPGPINVFFEGRYVGQMLLAEKTPGDPFTLGLGMDRAVSVKRQKIRDERQETAFFGKIERDSIIREIEYRITVENMKNRPIKLQIMDHLPVSRTDRITVKDVGMIPEPDQRNVGDKNGVMQWEINLAPGQTKAISISFTVSYPKEMPPPVF